MALSLLLVLALHVGAQQELPQEPKEAQASPQAPQGRVVGVETVERLYQGVRQRVYLLTLTGSYAPLMRPLWELTKRGVEVKVLAPQEAFDTPSSYLVPLAFLSLKRPNLEVKVLRGSKVDPRLLADDRYMLVGPPLDGLLPEASGPLLLFSEAPLVRAEVERFLLYWRLAPYCAPKARYREGKGVEAFCVPSPTKY